MNNIYQTTFKLYFCITQIINLILRGIHIIKRNTIIAICIFLLFFGSFFYSVEASKNSIELKNNKFIEKNFVPEYLKPGDIIFFECSNYSYFCPGWDHCGIYIGNNEFIHASEYLGFVAKHNISFFIKMDLEIVYGTVITANEEQKLKAIEFAESQIGKDYRNSYPKDPDPNSEAWSCSELLWAAYLHQGIDIDRNTWHFPKFVTTLDICWDDDVEMYTSHKMNKWYPGFYISWLINYIINYPRNNMNCLIKK